MKPVDPRHLGPGVFPPFSATNCPHVRDRVGDHGRADALRASCPAECTLGRWGDCFRRACGSACAALWMVAWACAMHARHAEPEDAASRILVRALGRNRVATRRLPGDVSLRAWVQGVLEKIQQEDGRAAKRLPQVNLSADLLEGYAASDGGGSDPDAKPGEDLVASDPGGIEARLALLTPKQCEAVELILYAGLSVSEIATRLQRSPRAIYERVERATRRLLRSPERSGRSLSELAAEFRAPPPRP